MKFTIYGYGPPLAVGDVALANCVREVPPDDALPGDEELPGDDAPALDEPAIDLTPPDFAPTTDDLPAQADDAIAQAENRDSHIATALAMYQTGQGKQSVCDWLASQCPQSIGTPEKAAKVLAGHNAGF